MPRVGTSALAALCLAASVVLAGCGADGDARDAASRPAAPTARPTDSDSDSNTATASPSARGSATAAGPTREPRGHKVGRLQPRMRLATAAHLLDAESLPPLGDGSWEVAATGPEDPERDGAVGACQKTLLGPIGAVETVRRTFTAPGPLAATQVVARFADSRSAWRAHQVLVAWRDDCADRVDGSAVGPLRPIDVRSGTGESYRTDARQRAAGLAILRTGSFLTLIEVTAGAAHYPTGWDPARVAARRVARTF